MSQGLILMLVAAGGACGALARYGTWYATQGSGAAFPWGTLIVNLAGGLAVGALMGWREVGVLREEWRLLLVVGFLGAYTTFSAFSYETIAMVSAGRGLAALGYVLSSVLGSLTMTAVSYATVRTVWR